MNVTLALAGSRVAVRAAVEGFEDAPNQALVDDIKPSVLKLIDSNTAFSGPVKLAVEAYDDGYSGPAGKAIYLHMEFGQLGSVIV